MDLNLLNANVNRLLTNTGNIISFLKEFTVDGAKDVSISYLNADGSESVRTFPNIAKQISLRNPKIDNIYFHTASYAFQASDTNITSLVNMDGNIVSVSDGTHIRFKTSGVFDIRVDCLARTSDMGSDPTKLGFSGGRHTLVGSILDINWNRVLLEKVAPYNANDTISLVYRNGRFGTWNDPVASNITITKLGE